jgi:hypothetical protein
VIKKILIFLAVASAIFSTGSIGFMMANPPFPSEPLTLFIIMLFCVSWMVIVASFTEYSE